MFQGFEPGPEAGVRQESFQERDDSFRRAERNNIN